MTLVITHTLLFFTKTWHVFCVCGELRSLKVIKTSLGPAPDKHVSWHNLLLYLKRVSVTAHHVDFNHASLMTGGRPLRRERLSDSKPTVWCCSYNRRPFRRPWVSRSNKTLSAYTTPRFTPCRTYSLGQKKTRWRPSPQSHLWSDPQLSCVLVNWERIL